MRLLLTITALLACQLCAAADALDVYKSPRCGCCTEWASYMSSNGFDVTLHDTENMQPIKAKAAIPAGKGSCHTAFVGGYVIEGHVPAEDVQRLLEEKPDAVGLTVPGMPIGSPGMEMGERKDAYDVLLIHPDGSTEVFARHNQAQ